MNSNILLMKIVFEFLNGLDDSQIEDLINKKVCLKLQPTLEHDKGKETSIPETDEYSIDPICTTLEEKMTRDDARVYLTEMGLNKATLKLLVKHYKIPLTSKATNPQMIDAIIEAVVGSKIRYEALYNTNLTK